MSRIGKQPVTLASGITVSVSPANEVTVKGPKGELKAARLTGILKIEVKDGSLEVTRPTDQIPPPRTARPVS